MHPTSSIEFYLFLLPACALLGWCIGKLDVDRIIQHTTDAYINRYNTLSGVAVTEVTYFLVSDHIDSVKAAALNIPGVIGIEASRINALFDVRVTYEERRNAVSALRDIAKVSAVFTVPFMCH